MPTVNGQNFPYTPEGMQKAEQAKMSGAAPAAPAAPQQNVDLFSATGRGAVGGAGRPNGKLKELRERRRALMRQMHMLRSQGATNRQTQGVQNQLDTVGEEFLAAQSGPRQSRQDAPPIVGQSDAGVMADRKLPQSRPMGPGAALQKPPAPAAPPTPAPAGPAPAAPTPSPMPTGPSPSPSAPPSPSPSPSPSAAPAPAGGPPMGTPPSPPNATGKRPRPNPTAKASKKLQQAMGGGY